MNKSQQEWPLFMEPSLTVPIHQSIDSPTKLTIYSTWKSLNICPHITHMILSFTCLSPIHVHFHNEIVITGTKKVHRP